ncbi:MAG: hypothetical protein H5T98_01005 [Syntrophomonadaceae bacterium]|nr:hypothetical protein [Syntrophomonadaceae bacterium]
MNAFEILNDPQRTQARAFDGRLANVWTSMPGIIQSFNAAEQTVVVQPAIRAIQFDKDGVSTNVDLPVLLDCPVQFPSGGGFTLTFPVAQGDECLIVFANRCIDAWWQSGGVQNQAVMRMHDLSDGFAVLGFSSVPRVIGNISATSTQLRSNDGAEYVEVGPGEVTLSAANVNVNASTAANLTAPNINLNGKVNNSTSGGTIGGITINTHTHGGVQPGSGTTAGPN